MKSGCVRVIAVSFVLIAAHAICVSTILGATVTVTTTADDATPNDGTVSFREAIMAINAGTNLGDPDIVAQNPGTFGSSDKINFNIAGSGVHTITLANTTVPLPNVTRPVTINGYSQPGTAVNTAANTDNAVLLIQLSGLNLTLQGGGCTVRGLIISGGSNGVTITGTSSDPPDTIAGNFIGTNAAGSAAVQISGSAVLANTGPTNNNVIGGTGLADRNLIGGAQTAGVNVSGTGNEILGNFIGTNAAGTGSIALSASAAAGILVAAGATSDTRIGGTAAGCGNVISGNGGAGILRATGVPGNTELPTQIQGNLIGTNAAGTAALPNLLGVSGYHFMVGGTTAASGNVISGNSGAGVTMFSLCTVQGNLIGTNTTGTVAIPNGIGADDRSTSSNLLGGTATGSGNVISGNSGDGVYVSVSTNTAPAVTQMLIQGNLIGTDASGTHALPNGGYGIEITNFGKPSSTVRAVAVGGSAAAAGNIIAFNGQAGVAVLNGTGHSIQSNSIFRNGGLGIDLNGDGVTLNDTADADTGPNNLQNFPVITSATVSGGVLTVSGTLNSSASTTFNVQFFSNDSADASGYGQGKTLLGAQNVSTDANGNGTYTVNFNSVAAGEAITATATDPNGNTSEFSAAVTAAAPTPTPTATPTPMPTPTPTPTATPTPPSQLLNLSTRKQVGTGDNVLIGGFIVVGTENKKVLVRGLGPSLPVQGALTDPTLELHQADTTLLAFDDNWRDKQQDEIIATGIPPNNDLESAIVATLAAKPGSEGGAGYTGVLAGEGGTSGIGLLEIYDLAIGVNSKLANISTRGFVGTGDDLLIGGFIPGPSDRLPMKVLVRALGPSLSGQGVSGALQDPFLELHDANGTLLTNDDWRDSQQSEIAATGIPPSDDREAAIVTTVPPSNAGYTAVVRGKNGATGVALVEVYNLQ
jgi:hypothetical protein